jgi:two-component system OmpR family sensor kinase
VSIRLRLTVLYSAILVLTLIAFSGVLYVIQSQYTLNIVKRDLSASANGLILGLVRAAFNLSWRDQSTRVPWPRDVETDRSPPAPQPLEFRDLRTRDTVRLLDVGGAPLVLSINEESEELPISQAGLEQLRNGQPWIEIAHREEGRMLVYSQPVVIDGETIGIVQVARSLMDRDRSLQALGATLALGSLLTTAIAFGLGWLLAGVTLGPIHPITQTAIEIGQTRDFSSRVQHKGPDDELGRLAATFNGMLARLADAYQQVTHALEVQRGFVADVSHELRTPLTTIRGNLALLHREPRIPPAEQEDIVNDLIGENERLIRLVTDLLILARADTGRKLSCEHMAVQPLIDEACRQARLLEPGREIVCQSADDITALADPDALKQVLLILIDNAIKHADGPIRVVLDECDSQLRISVQDSGPGMSPEVCERIFDRFYRGDESRTTPGFGLGLSIAKALIEAQGGSIAVESRVGEGSTFVVRMFK